MALMRYYDVPLTTILQIIDEYESNGIHAAVKVGNVDISTVYRILKRYGIPTKASMRCRGEVRDKAIELYKSGVSSEKVAEILGVSDVYVVYVARKAGVEIRPSGARKGITLSEEHKNRMSESQKARHNLPQYDGFNGYGREQADSRGYIKVLCPGHPRASKHQHYIYMHIVIAEQTLGRRLNQDEVVHHINGDKSDNRPENLKVMTRSEHIKLHERMRKEKCRKSL